MLDQARTRATLQPAIDRAVDFLLRRQSASGAWIDWSLPPGSSGPWTTAYVGCQLASTPADPLPRRLAIDKAAQWLLAHACRGGGFSYNESVECDADSTAWAILLLQTAGHPVADLSRRLLGFQHADGGFATYAADAGLGSWGHPHADVTAVVVRALVDDVSTGTACERALRYLRGGRRPDGLWNSFWWATPLYATAACLRLAIGLETSDRIAVTHATLRDLPAGSAFETALLLESMLYVARQATLHRQACPGGEDRIDALVSSLLARQLVDGSWPSAPMLRVSDRRTAAPWEHAGSGEVYADPERLFTSATVLRALCVRSEPA